ncbi:MAG: substrate-binding domain-containing protein [Planctomycetota bacterium]|nr:substrate-binding domain-containing protein [Planctomycetota bacterium]
MGRTVLTVGAIVAVAVLVAVTVTALRGERRLDRTGAEAEGRKSPEASDKPDKRAGGDTSGAPEGLLILCGGSFRPPGEKLVAAFEKATGIKCTMSFGGSEDLLPQIKLSKQGDIFITHDPFGDFVRDAGSLSRYVAVGYLVPVLVVQKGNPKNIKSVDDLTRPGLRACMTDPKYTTCGEMLVALMEKKGIREAVEKNIENAIFRTHNQVCNAVKMDHRDAGVAWNGIAFNFRDALDAIPINEKFDREVRVLVVGLNYSKRPDDVEKFLKFAEKEGAAIFREHRYVKEGP